MDDLFISVKEMKEDLKHIENLGSDLSRELSLLSQKVRYLFSKIKMCETIELAKKYFDILDKIQLTLATLVFKEEIGIPEHLGKFVSDFDNFENVKEYYFIKIKNNEYTF